MRYRGKNELKFDCSRKKGMHGYRAFLCVLLIVIVAGTVWYFVTCQDNREIPADGTLVHSMHTAEV